MAGSMLGSDKTALRDAISIKAPELRLTDQRRACVAHELRSRETDLGSVEILRKIQAGGDRIQLACTETAGTRERSTRNTGSCYPRGDH